MHVHRRHGSFKAIAVLFIILHLSFFTGCATAAYQTQETWIDQPFGLAEFPAGKPFVLLGHAFAKNGVAEVASYIDGDPYNLFSPDDPGSTFSAFSNEILITAPGFYVLSVVSFDSQGTPSEPAFIRVNITGGEQPIIMQDTAEPLETPKPTAAVQKTEPPPAAQATKPPAAVQVTDMPTIQIKVNTPTPDDTQPPEIKNISHTPQEIWNYHTCGPVEFDIRAQVNDPSGVKKVEVKLRVVKDGSPGAWVTAKMNQSGDWYQATISTAQLKASMDGYRGTVEYTISAIDKKGNSTTSPARSLPVRECLI